MYLTKVVFLVLTLWVRDTHSAALSDAELTRKVNYLFLSEYLSVYIHYTSTKSWRSRIFLWFVCVWGVGGVGVLFITPPRNRGRVVFLLWFVYMCVCVWIWVYVGWCEWVCVWVCVCMWVCMYVCICVSFSVSFIIDLL